MQVKTQITLTQEDITKALIDYVSKHGVDIERQDIEFVLEDGAVESFAATKSEKRVTRRRRKTAETKPEPVVDEEAVEEVEVQAKSEEVQEPPFKEEEAPVAEAQEEVKQPSKSLMFQSIPEDDTGASAPAFKL